MSTDIGIFDKLLEKGEYLEWFGKAEPFKLNEGMHKKKLTIRFIICAVVAIVLTAAYAVFVQTSKLEFMVAIPVITIFVPVFAAIRPFIDARNIQNKMTFAITNRRIMICKSETKCSSMRLKDIEKVKIIDNGNNTGHVAFGAPAVSAPDNRLFNIVMQPKTKIVGGQESVCAMAFYNVPELKKIKSIMNNYVTVIDGSAA